MLAGVGAVVGLSIWMIFQSTFGAPPVPSLASMAASASNSTCVQDQRLLPPLVAVSAKTLSPQQVARIASRAGFRGSDLVIAVAVSAAESARTSDLTNLNTNGSTDYGLFQINSIHQAILAHGHWDNPNDNAVMAYQIFTEAGSNWSPWVTFNTGSYRQFMDEAQAAVGGIGDLAQSLGCSAATVTGNGVGDPGVGPQGPDGMTPRASSVRATTRATWGCKVIPQPCVSSIGGYSPRNIAGTTVLSDHATGNAVDIMLNSDYRSAAKQGLGQQIATFWMTHAKQAGVKYVIFDSKIWNAQRNDPVVPWSAWRPYTHPGCGGDTCQHVDHVHVSVLS